MLDKLCTYSVHIALTYIHTYCNILPKNLNISFLRDRFTILDLAKSSWFSRPWLGHQRVCRKIFLTYPSFLLRLLAFLTKSY
jgi:hypothetical protein